MRYVIAFVLACVTVRAVAAPATSIDSAIPEISDRAAAFMLEHLTK